MEDPVQLHDRERFCIGGKFHFKVRCFLLPLPCVTTCNPLRPVQVVELRVPSKDDMSSDNPDLPLGDLPSSLSLGVPGEHRSPSTDPTPVPLQSQHIMDGRNKSRPQQLK